MITSHTSLSMSTGCYTRWLDLVNFLVLPNFLPKPANFFTRIYPPYPDITRYRWISPDITRSNIIHQDVVWSWSSHQSAVWPIRLCCKWRRILMFFLHRASIYWICTPVPLILLFWADARFERPFPRFMFLFHKPLRICAAAVFINPSGADFPVPYVLP